MCDGATKPRQVPYRKRSIYRVHYCLPLRRDDMARPLWPTAHAQLHAYDRQVAGHNTNGQDNKYLGLLQCNNGTILKPIIKSCQQREVDFYNRLSECTHSELVELRTFVPKYFGCKKHIFNGFEQEYIILEDLTHKMIEPCIMDVKIGRQTWDPLASAEKIRKEQNKYSLCKEQYNFCIPGFQVYDVATGKLLKYNKEYGKGLYGDTVMDAIKHYLNGASRVLLLQFLSELWKIQKFWSRQTSLQLYSASLLLVYDAARLRICAKDNTSKSSETLRRRKHPHSMPNLSGSNFSGQITSMGPVFKKVNSVPLTPLTLRQNSFSAPPVITSPWSDALEKLKHSHSFDNNYEDKLSEIKINYRTILDRLASDSKLHPWGTVKVIDFAHAFFNDENAGVDTNFKAGIDSFVHILENFLRETD